MGKRLFEKISFGIDSLLDIIFPKPMVCSGCGRILKEVSKYRLCLECYGKIIFYDSCSPYDTRGLEFDNAIISCRYEGLVREMLHRIKYKDKREIAVTIAAIMADNITREYLDYDLIVPVPISARKLKKRGYNHVFLMAVELSEVIKIPVLNCIKRIKDTQPQVLFSSQDRWYNVKGCFKANAELYGKKILLLDDIMTTGATAHYCAEEIKKAGAAMVTVCSFAKSNLL